MASKTLTFDIFGRDKGASKTIGEVGKSAQSMGDQFAKVGKAVGAGLLVAGAAVIAFGVDSVKAYAEAQKSQARLADAFDRFPKLADTNLRSLQKFNTEIIKKTRYDDDAVASGQAVLAQYNLTGDQLKTLSPLLLDYAAKTGKDIPAAAEDLGKAMLGQGRALKDIGIDFVDTGTVAGNFDSIVGDLRTQVGGFAAVDGATAEGRLEGLRNKFGEVQEKIGEALMPAMEALISFGDSDFIPWLDKMSDWFVDDGIPAIQGVVDWMTKYKDILGPAAIALGALTAAQWVLNAAMTANPVGLVIVGLAALISYLVLVFTNIENIFNAIYPAWSALTAFGLGIGRTIASAFDTVINGITGGVNTVIDLVNPILSALGMGTVGRVGRVNFAGMFEKAQSFVGSMNVLQAATSGGRSSGGGGGSPARKMATGGVVMPQPGGMFANIGEAGDREAVLPLTPSVLAGIGAGIRAADGGGGSDRQITVVLESRGGIDLTQYIKASIREEDAASNRTFRMGRQNR